MTEDIFYGFLAVLFVWMVDICLMEPIGQVREQEIQDERTEDDTDFVRHWKK